MRSHSNPHFHSQDRRAAVTERVWSNGVGKELDFNKAILMKADSYLPHPAKAVHWDGGGDEDVVVRIIGEGSVETTAAGARSAPRSYWPKPK
jgi:hypothetical protein